MPMCNKGTGTISNVILHISEEVNIQNQQSLLQRPWKSKKSGRDHTGRGQCSRWQRCESDKIIHRGRSHPSGGNTDNRWVLESRELPPGHRKEDAWKCAMVSGSDGKKSQNSEMTCRLIHAGNNQWSWRVLHKLKHITETRKNNNKTYLFKEGHMLKKLNFCVPIEANTF